MYHDLCEMITMIVLLHTSCTICMFNNALRSFSLQIVFTLSVPLVAHLCLEFMKFAFTKIRK